MGNGTGVKEHTCGSRASELRGLQNRLGTLCGFAVQILSSLI